MRAGVGVDKAEDEERDEMEKDWRVGKGNKREHR